MEFLKKLLCSSIICVFCFSGLACRSNESSNQTLCLYTDASTKQMVEDILKSYRVHHPEVEIFIEDISNLSEDEYNARLSGEIMGGQGPDVIIADARFLESKDIYKLMQAGAFEDLNSYFEAVGFDWNQYGSVMEAGVYQGHRMIVPLSFSIPLPLTSENALKTSQFNLSNCGDGLSIMRELARCSSDWKNGGRTAFGDRQQLPYYYNLLSLSPLDYEGKALKFDERLKEAMVLYRELYEQESREPSVPDTRRGRWHEWDDKERLFELYWADFSLAEFMFDSAQIQAFDQAVVLPFYDADGQIPAKIETAIAVNKGSKNKEAAFYFVETALKQYQNVLASDAVESLMVKKEAVRPFLQNFELITSKPSGGVATQSTVVTMRMNYISSYGEERRIDSQRDCKSTTQEYTEQIFGYCDDSELNSFFPSALELRFVEQMRPFYEGSQTYEQCVDQFRASYEYYLTE